MKRLWPGLKRKQRLFRVLPSHDVDIPLQEGFRPIASVIRRAAGDVLKRKSVSLAMKNAYRWAKIKASGNRLDPYNTFAFLMSESEKRGLRSSFYFLPEPREDRAIAYRIEHPWMIQLMQEIDRRGHEIGYHAGYETYLDLGRTGREADRLRRALADAGIPAALRGGRQHYLRWRTPVTFYNLQAAGLLYDSSLGFADRVGFRCGACYEFPAFDVQRGQRIGITERPLVVMEGSLLSSQHEGLGLSEEALKLLLNLKRACRLFAGDFTILWHNSSLLDPASRDFYKAILDA
jgi:hypothetical protein